jgi:hypothetical protein
VVKKLYLVHGSFVKIGAGKGVLFVQELMKLRLRVYLQTVQHFETKNTLVKSVYYVMAYTICGLVYQMWCIKEMLQQVPNFSYTSL